MFGTNKAYASEGVSIGVRAGELNPAFAQSMPNFNFEKQQSHVGNPLKMIKEYKS